MTLRTLHESSANVFVVTFRIVASIALVGLVYVLPANAQYTANFQTNIISGVTSNWVDNPSNLGAGYVVGSNWVYDTLLVNGGGVLSNSTGYIGYKVGANNNSVIVSDSGSLWTNTGSAYVGYQGSSNTLLITNGADVVSDSGFVGASSSATNNS